MIAVGYFDDEIEAEIARGALESEGIAAQVHFMASSGYPRYAAGSGGFGIGAPLSRWELLVPKEDAREANRILDAREPAEPHPHPWRRWVFRGITFLVLLAFLWTALQQLSVLF